MVPKIHHVSAKKLIGKKRVMSLLENRTFELWSEFMQHRKKITNTVSDNLYSLQRYNSSYFEKFKPDKTFEKWALMEVDEHKNIPENMEAYTLDEGMYAVFQYQGQSDDATIYNFVYTTWLPNSPYTLDDRPHFSILGEKYFNDISSQEEIWIPIKEDVSETIGKFQLSRKAVCEFCRQ